MTEAIVARYTENRMLFMSKPAKKKCSDCPYYPSNKGSNAKSLRKAMKEIKAYYRRVKKEKI